MQKQRLKVKVNAEEARRPGFTIIEILLVVLIIAFVAGLGGGLWVGTYKRLQVKKAGCEFVLAAKYARNMAISRQRPCRMELNAENNGFDILTYEFNEESEETELVPVRDIYFNKAVEFDGDIELEVIRIGSVGTIEPEGNNSKRTITFSPDGTAQSAIVQIGDGRNHCTASICAATARARMQLVTADKIKSSTFDLDQGQRMR